MAAGTDSVLSITEETDAPHPRLRIVLAGRIDGDQVADRFIRLYAANPVAATFDRLFDLTGYEAGFEVRHLQRIAPAYRQANPDPDHPCRTAFVTRDPNFALWTKSMGYQFNGRDFRAFMSFEEAERWLDQPPAERPAPTI